MFTTKAGRAARAFETQRGASFVSGVETTPSVEVERVPVGRVLVLLGPLHGLAELLFEQALAVFHRAEFLREDLVAHLLAALQLLRHLRSEERRVGKECRYRW